VKTKLFLPNQIIQSSPSFNCSISDEILGDDDLQDVDAVFESLLNNTFDERSGATRHVSRREALTTLGRQPRSKSSHQITFSPEVENVNKSERKRSTGRTSSVTR